MTVIIAVRWFCPSALASTKVLTDATSASSTVEYRLAMMLSSVFTSSALLGFVTLGVILTAHRCAYSEPDPRVTTVLVVRHAEELGGRSDDPALSGAGAERANQLKQALRSVEVDVVYATQALRTQQTARPVAETRGLPVKQVDADSIDSAVSRILSDHAGQTVLVVAHTRTAMLILERLGVPLESLPGNPFARYDDLFVVTVWGEGKARAVRLKYGDPQQPRRRVSSRTN